MLGTYAVGVLKLGKFLNLHEKVNVLRVLMRTAPGRQTVHEGVVNATLLCDRKQIFKKRKKFKNK